MEEQFETLKSAAQERLGSLYDPADYPPHLDGLFAVEWEFPSVEPPDYLQRLNPQLFQQERQRIAARFDEAVRLAEEAFASEFAALVDHLVERLGGGVDGKPKVFRDSAVQNLTEFFERFRRLNVRSSAELDALVEEARRLVQGVSPQQLRDSDSLRQQIAGDMARVRERVEGLITDAPRRRLVRARPSGNGGDHAAGD